MPDSVPPHGLYPTRFLCPWGFSGKNTGLGWHLLLPGIVLTQGSNPRLLLCRLIPYLLSHPSGMPKCLCFADEENRAQTNKRIRSHSAGNWWGWYLSSSSFDAQELSMMWQMSTSLLPEMVSFCLLWLYWNKHKEIDYIYFNFLKAMCVECSATYKSCKSLYL